MKKLSRQWYGPLLFITFILIAQAFRVPSPVWDMAADHWASGYSIHLPFWHLVFTPFCSVADLLSVLSRKEDLVLCGYVLAGAFLFRRWLHRALFLLGFLFFVAWGVLVPRPMARLVANDPQILLIDFHSHSRISHDGRGSFTPQANMNWHRRQGYEAAFITDHNLVQSAQEAKAESQQTWVKTGYRSLIGEEISLAHTHLVILGNPERVDNRPFDSDPNKIALFVRTMHAQRIPVIGSLPEYWRDHWAKGNMDFETWGLDGFEIVNSAPKGLDFPPSLRRRIVELCRERNLFVTGISDNHGYGYATAAWNAVRIPGWQQMGPNELEHAVLRHLREKGFGAVQVLGRAKFLPETGLGLVMSPLANFWLYWRSLQMSQALAWIFWIELFVVTRHWIRFRRSKRARQSARKASFATAGC